MTWGTSYFPTRGDAHKYFRPMGYFSFQVDNKITDGDIHIGKPKLREGETCHLMADHGGSQRWFITEGK